METIISDDKQEIKDIKKIIANKIYLYQNKFGF
jgi:hypothetical protein